MSAAPIQRIFDRFSVPLSSEELTDRLNKFIAKLEQQFANVQTSINAVSAGTAPAASNPLTNNAISSISSGGGTGPVTPSGGTLQAETPAGTIDGSNPTFTITYAPINGIIFLFRNGQLQQTGTDYVLNGTTITMNPAPAVNDQLFTFYWRY